MWFASYDKLISAPGQKRETLVLGSHLVHLDSFLLILRRVQVELVTWVRSAEPFKLDIRAKRIGIAVMVYLLLFLILM